MNCIHEVKQQMTRRGFLGASVSALIAAGIMPREAMSATAPHKFQVGDYNVEVFTDGFLTAPLEMMFPENSDEERAEFAKLLGWTGGMGQPDVNIPLLRSGSDLILVDIGSGEKNQDSVGRLEENLRAAGVTPEDITAVLNSHAHGDHIFAALREDGSLRYPNATYYVSANEWKHWMNPDLVDMVPEQFRPGVVGAQRDLAAIAPQMQIVEGGDTIVSGLNVVDLPGHTPGHVGFEVEGGDGLLIVADSVINEISSLRFPAQSFLMDTIPDMATATRRSVLDRAATDRSMVLGYHWTNPGVGHVERNGDSYVFLPA